MYELKLITNTLYPLTFRISLSETNNLKNIILKSIHFKNNGAKFNFIILIALKLKEH